MRAVVINAYSVRNAGDAAIMLATSRLLKSNGIDTISISSRHWDEDIEFYRRESLSSIPPIIPFPAKGTLPEVSRLLMFAMAILGAFVVALIYRLRASAGMALAHRFSSSGLGAALASDAIVLAGGGYLYSARRRVNLTLLHVALQICIAVILQKPILMMPQSIGPIGGKLDVLLVRAALRKVETLVVRDDYSVKTVVDELKLSNQLVLTPDIVFYGAFTPEEFPAEGYDDKLYDLMIVTMDWTWARRVSPSALVKYIDKIAMTVESCCSGNFRVCLAGNSRIPEQDQDDFRVARMVYDRLTPRAREATTVLPDTTDLRSLCRAMSKSRVVVGTRLHSCILSLTLGVPTVALAYQPKTTGTYSLLNLADWCLDVESFTSDELAGSVKDLHQNSTEAADRVNASVGVARRQILETYATTSAKIGARS